MQPTTIYISIRFNIPESDPGYNAIKGVWTIKPDSIFEYIIDNNLIIDGFSQSSFIGSDSNPFGPEIVIDGSNAGQYSTCLNSYADGTEVYGLTINRFGGTGIVFSLHGLGIVSGCYIGTDYSGMNAAGNNFGIGLWYKVKGVHIGPSEYNYPNVISGNSQTGIFLADSSMFNVIVGNFIGLNREGTDTVSNYLRGIDLERSCDENEIYDNHIGGNIEGISIIESNYNEITHNFIGVNESWENDLGNGSGISIWGNSSNNKIRENIIGYNWSGIIVDSASSIHNTISRNLISKNVNLGIDNRNGGNTELIPPVITFVTINEINGTAGANQIVEIFADDDDEGRIFIESTVADAQGDFTLSVSSLPELPNITATARDVHGNTSEFSSPFILTDIEEEKNTLPTEYALYQNYPNPFNPKTVIKYQIPKNKYQINSNTQNSNKVTLGVYDVLGNEVASLVNQHQKPGNYEVNFNASDLPSGVYFYRLKTEYFSQTKKMLLLK